MAGSMVACSPEDIPGMSEAAIPVTSEYTSAIKVTVDQSTNNVTFNLDAPGVYPVWVINTGDGEVRSSRNGFTRAFLVAGTYSYKCYVANRNGVCKSCAEGTFTLNESRIDISKEIGYLTSKPWHIAGSKPGHLGCGESLGNPTNWWSAAPNDKKDWGVYDCVLTFDANGSYTFNPGESGVLYANKGVTVNGWGQYYLGDDQDYNVIVDGEQTSNWKIEIKGTELWLNLGSNPYFPYIANDEAWSNPVYKIISISAKSMTLVETTPGISWQYILTTEEEGGKDSKDLLVGTWSIDNTKPGHLGCGEALDKATNWWSAGPNEKADYGVYDCVLTFDADGTYTFNAGATDMIYVNKDVKVNGWDANYPGDGNDYNVKGVGTQTSKWSIKDEVINLGSNPYFPYIANDDVWNNPEYHITNITDTEMTLVIWNGGIAWQYILKKEVVTPESILTGSNWAIDPEAYGHLGCGESMANSGGWWSAGANEKADYGVYDCVLTFAEDGTYTMNSGETDMIYVNKDVKVNGWDANYLGDDQDYNVKGVGTQTSTWSLSGDIDDDMILNLGENPYFPYIANDDVWNNPEYHVQAIAPNQIKLVIWNGGIAWQYILKPVK